MRPRLLPLLAIAPALVGFSPLRWLDPAVGANREGTQQYEAGRFEDAAKSYSQGVAADPGRPELLYNLGNSLERLGKHEEAGAAYRQSLEQAPTTLAPDAWYNLGNSLLAAGQGKAAVQAYREALVRNPSHEGAKRNLEFALEQAKKEPPKPNQGNGNDDDENKGSGDQQQNQNRDPRTAKNDGDQRKPADSPQQGEPQKADDSSQRPSEPPSDTKQPNEQPKPDDPRPDADRPSPTDDDRSRAARREGDERDLTRDQAEGLLRSFEQMERRQLQESHPPKDAGLGGRGRDW